MESAKILNSLLGSGAVSDDVALEVLTELHQRGSINLLAHLNEQSILLLSESTSRETLTTVSGNIDVMLGLIPSVDAAEVLDVVESTESSSVADILGASNER